MERNTHIYHRIKIIQDPTYRLTNPNATDNSGAVQYVDIFPYLKHIVFTKDLPSKDEINDFNLKYHGTAYIDIIEDDNISLRINRPWCDDIKRLSISSIARYEDNKFSDYLEIIRYMRENMVANGTTLGVPAICDKYMDEIYLMNRTLGIMKKILEIEDKDSPLQYLNQLIFEICLYRDRLQSAIFEEQNATKAIYETYRICQGISYYELYVNGQDLRKNKKLREYLRKLEKENV